jgi:hypothetical protein
MRRGLNNELGNILLTKPPNSIRDHASLETMNMEARSSEALSQVLLWAP